MEELIKQAFLHVDVIGPHVQEGHYDLIGPDGEIILPTVWEKVIEPDWAITMHMWPMDKNPLRGPPPGAMPMGGRHGHAGQMRGMPPGMMPPGMRGVPPPRPFPGAGMPAPPPGWPGRGMGMMPPGRGPPPDANVITVDPSHRDKKKSSSSKGASGLSSFLNGGKTRSNKKYVLMTTNKIARTGRANSFTLI